MHVAILGNLSDGFAVFGPFQEMDDAFKFADTRPEFGSWIMTLEGVAPPTLVDEDHSALAAMFQRVFELSTISAFTSRDKDFVAEFHDFVVNCPWLEETEDE